jgi:hypothetical protein
MDRMSSLALGSTFGGLMLTAALVLPSPANAGMVNLGLTWTNTKNASDTFSGTLKVDSALFPSSGEVNLATTSATLSVTIPQLGKTTYTMADLAKFSVALSSAEASKLVLGQDLLNPDVVGKVIVFGKPGTPAHKNFNQCASEYGICFNREAQPPVYNLTSMKVLSLTR